MAAPGPPQQQNPSSSSVSAPQQPQIPTNPDQISWDGDKMFNIYILDYCKKRGYRKTASELVSEADISPDSKPPINAQQGLLFEWWSVFWVLFQAKNNGAGSEDAMLYHKHQNQLKLRAGQVPPPGVPQAARYLPNGVSGPVPPLPAAHMNGIGPGGQPTSLSGPAPYGPANPAGQPNGIPGPPPAPPGAPGQPFPGGMAGRPQLGPQQRLPNGPQQFRSPTMAPSPQAQGNPPQPPAGAMAQLGRSPHMSTVNRAAMPPPNGPQHPQGPGPTGSAHPTPTLSYQQLGRPPSSHGISTQNPMNPHQSPAMVAGRIPPGQDRAHMDIDNELASYSIEIVGEAKRQTGLSDKDPQSLTIEEKQNILNHVGRLRQNPPNAGPSGVNPHGQLPNRGPMAQPMQSQLSMPQRGKRNSTSPGEQHPTLPRNDQSPPDRKRPRRTPIPAEQHQQQPQLQQQQQQQPQQSQPQPPPPTPQQPQQTPQPPQHQQPQQPPMTPMGPLPSGPQPGPVRGPLPMTGGQPPPNGFSGPPMHQMVGPGPMTPMHHAMSPGMGHGPPMGVINPQQMVQSQVLYQGQYRPGLVNSQVNSHKGNPNMPVHPLDPQSHLRGPGPGPGPVQNRLSGPLVPTQSAQPPKGMPMPPPGQPGTSGPPKPGGKEGEGELNAPLNPAASAPTSGPLHNSAPPMNPQRPPTANAPMPTPAPPPPPAPGPGPAMGDLSFESYMTDMFGSNGGDFDFGPSSLDNMDLWLETSNVNDSSIDMK